MVIKGVHELRMHKINLLRVNSYCQRRRVLVALLVFHCNATHNTVRYQHDIEEQIIHHISYHICVSNDDGGSYPELLFRAEALNVYLLVSGITFDAELKWLSCQTRKFNPRLGVEACVVEKLKLELAAEGCIDGERVQGVILCLSNTLSNETFRVEAHISVVSVLKGLCGRYINASQIAVAYDLPRNRSGCLITS